MTFEQNWNNLLARKEASDAGILNKAVKDQYPLTPQFVKWANLNWEAVERKLCSPELEKVHSPFTPQDYTNLSMCTREKQHIEGVCSAIWVIDSETGRLVKTEIEGENFRHAQDEEPAELNRLRKLFPVSKELISTTINMGKLIEKIDQRIASWNPRVRSIAQNPTDEFGNPLDSEYVQEPEIIGAGHVSDVPEINPHFAGTDEYGEDIYRDFDEDGYYLPQGNPNNSSDTREDIDLVDSQDGYRSQDWQSADFMDDHHHDNYHYQETGITENPNFDKYGNIEWSEVEHCDANEIVEPTSIYEKDESFLQDALNWIQREQYMEKAQESEPVVMWDVEQAFPVSEYFLERLKDLEMDWETFQTRLGEELCNLETQQVEEAAIHIHSMYKKTTRGNPLTVYEFIQGLRENHNFGHEAINRFIQIAKGNTQAEAEENWV